MDKLAVSSVTGELSLTIDLKKMLALAQESPFFNGSNGSLLDQLVKLGVSDTQALFTIGALDNTQLQMKVLPTGDVAVTAVRLDQFVLFPKLPLELRMRIWEEACSEPRIVEVDIFAYPAGKSVIMADRDYTTRTPTPSVLHVCSEARQIGLKHYNRAFRRVWWFTVEDVKEHIIYVNFEQDTVLLSHGQQRVGSQNLRLLWCGIHDQAAYYPDTLCRIKRIAIPMPPRPSVDVFKYGFLLKACTGLTEVILICGQDENGFVMMQKASMNQYPSDSKRVSFSELPSGEMTSCEEFVRELKCRLQKATNERLPPLIICKRLERI